MLGTCGCVGQRVSMPRSRPEGQDMLSSRRLVLKYGTSLAEGIERGDIIAVCA